MGNCCETCFGKLNKRNYLRTRYNVERDFSIEFENLMDDENQTEEMARVVSSRERQLLKDLRFDDLLHEQRQIDAVIDDKLAKQEEELRQEEDAYYEAKREAARAAKQQRQREQSIKNPGGSGSNGTNNWLGDDENEWEVAGGEDDFEMFLASVKARSLTARRQLQNVDTQSNASSNLTKERSQTEASSIDLEWEHEAGDPAAESPNDEGMNPQPRARSTTEEDLAGIAAKLRCKNDSPVTSNELEWDNDFVSADALESEQLIRRKKSEDLDADR